MSIGTLVKLTDPMRQMTLTQQEQRASEIMDLVEATSSEAELIARAKKLNYL